MQLFSIWEAAQRKPEPDEELEERLMEILHSAFWLKQILRSYQGNPEVTQKIEKALKLLHEAGEDLGIFGHD